jgi:thiol:disulfide interchange protein
LNQPETKAFVEANGIVTLQADKTHSAPEVDELLVQLGNTGRSIPFYAIFPADNPNKPILMDGIITSPSQIIAKFKQAVGEEDDLSAERETAMASPPR